MEAAMKNFVGALVGASLTIVSASHVNATAYSYSTTIDLATGVHSSVLGFDVFDVAISGASSFPLRNGDTISGTILFADNKAITLHGPDYSYAYLNMVSNIANVTTSEDMTIGLLGVTGSMRMSNPYNSTISSGFGAVGP